MKAKLLVGFLLTMTLFFILMPTTVSAAAGYEYRDENGQLQSTGDAAVSSMTADTAALSNGWYIVDSNISQYGTIAVSGSVNLILADGYELSVTGSSGSAGILVLEGNSLTIYGQSAGTGKLTVTGGENGAGIGGRDWQLAGTISINGGIIDATGGQYGAGIGGGRSHNGGTTTINGGNVTARGGQDGAGIGGGSNETSYPTLERGSGGTINIKGGNVTAIGNGGGAGIGGGRRGLGGNISISAGNVEATSGDVTSATGGAGIGGGAGKGANNINISGGTVVARALDLGAAVGGGSNGAGGVINISGATVTATAGNAGQGRGAGIGGGDRGNGGTITISNSTIHARAEYGGAGIGGGFGGSSGIINIDGGHITSYGGQWGAGIGGGGGASCDAITITDGIVNAVGDYNANPHSGGAGIGSGGANADGSQKAGIIKISGGKISAKGGSLTTEYARDIGRGRNSINGEVIISDAAIITLCGQGVEGSGLSLGTCVIKGNGAAEHTGVYEGGNRIDTVIIDLEDKALSSGSGYTISEGTVVLGNGTFALVGDSGETGRSVRIAEASNTNVIMFTAGIAPANGPAIDMTGANVDLHLIANSSLSGGTDSAGIQAPSGSHLTIHGSGSLTSTGGNNGAGIGGGAGKSGGSISINGGTVNAVGNGGGAGVGGGKDSDGGTVSVDGENTVLTATGGGNLTNGDFGFDIGSGNRQTALGTLELTNGATINLTRNGTDSLKLYIRGTVSGAGAALDAGQYLDTKKLLTCTGIEISPASGVKSFDQVTLSANFNGLSTYRPQGQIVFKSNDLEIGQVPLYWDGGSANAKAILSNWTVSGSTHLLTAEYVQNPESDSYYMFEKGSLTFEAAQIEQDRLYIGGIPDYVTYVDEPFRLSVSGGSGTGSIRYSVTDGNAISIDSSTGLVSIVKAGQATITVTNSGDRNYKPISTHVTVTVHKGVPPTVKFPSAAALTYGQTLNASALTGGSGDGTFRWENPDARPTVKNNGYEVIFVPRDADNYDYSGIVFKQTINISVNKAVPNVNFPFAGDITYGMTLSDSVLSFGYGDGNFAWESPDTVPTVYNRGYNMRFTPHDTDNYNEIIRSIRISVFRAEQAPLLISTPPVTYGDAPFRLAVSGGSGTGNFSYSISGSSLSVDYTGLIRVLKAGETTIIVIKEGDMNYNSTRAEVVIEVKKAEPAVEFPSAATLTYGQTLNDSALTGGSGDGSFIWENPETIPSVKNNGYPVIFTPRDTDNFDYSGIEFRQSMPVTVMKAIPEVTFPTASELTYEQNLSASVLAGGSGDGSFAWENPDLIPTVVNSGYKVIFTPHDPDNYFTLTYETAVLVHKAEQAPLLVSTPSVTTCGDAPFRLAVSGGSGAGTIRYALTEGDAVKINPATGMITTVKAGTATITVKKAGDSNYKASKNSSITFTVDKAMPTVVFPTAASITYGQTLSSSTLTGGRGAGVFTWERPNLIPDAGNKEFRMVFTPGDTDNFVTVGKDVKIYVNKTDQTQPKIIDIIKPSAPFTPPDASEDTDEPNSTNPDTADSPGIEEQRAGNTDEPGSEGTTTEKTSTANTPSEQTEQTSDVLMPLLLLIIGSAMAATAILIIKRR